MNINLLPKYQRKAALGLILIAACLIAAPSVLKADVFSGVNTYGTDVTGAPHTTARFWGSAGGGFTAFVNIGGFVNTAAVPNLNFTITPGAYTFSIYMDGVSAENRVALNLYFNGNTGAPNLSLLAQPNVAGFGFNPAVTNLSLNGGVDSPGAHSLTYSTGTNLITVTGFSWSNVGNGDTVGPFLLPSDGVNDSVATVSFTVAAVPEPSTLFLAGTGLGLLGLSRLRVRRAGGRAAGRAPGRITHMESNS